MGRTVDVELSLQVAVAVYVAAPYSLIDAGPLMDRPVKVFELPPPSPPPPPHVKRTIAINAKNIEAGRYVNRIFLISISLLNSPIVKRGDHRRAAPLGLPRRSGKMNPYLRPLRGPDMDQIEVIKGIGNRSENMEDHLPLLMKRENGCLKVA